MGSAHVRVVALDAHELRDLRRGNRDFGAVEDPVRTLGARRRREGSLVVDEVLQVALRDQLINS